MSSQERVPCVHYTVSMYLRASLFAALLLFPSVSFAASTYFPEQSLWLSDTKPTEGEKVRLYTVVYNGSQADISGTLTFYVDSKTQDTKDLALKSGESTVLSTVWTAEEGEHSFSARFAGRGSAESESAVSASIVAKVDAPPSAVEQTLTQAKDVGSQIASTSIPVVSAVAGKVFETTESLRNAGIEYLENNTASASRAQRATSSPIEGFEAPTTTVADVDETGIVGNIAQTASAAALFTLRSMWLFYPLLLLALLLVFRWLYKWATGPRF